MLENGLRVGLIGEAIETVREEMTALKMGSGAVSVYATPAMIALMESAAVSAVDPHLPEGFVSVGIELDVRHLAATPIGEGVVAMAEIVNISGKRVTLEVRAWDEHELIGQGKHIRYLIHIDDFMERIKPGDA